MGLVIFKRYNNIGDALVAYSALESAGFHPSWHNYNHAHIEYMSLIAFGGLIILLPASEVIEAHKWLAELRQQPTQDGDDIPERKYGMWRHNLSITAFNTPAIILIPILWMRWWIYLFIMGAILALVAGTFGIDGLFFKTLFFLIIAAIISAFAIFAYLLPPLVLLAFWLIGLNILIFYGGITELFLAAFMSIIPIGILLHAKHIAVPKLLKRNASNVA